MTESKDATRKGKPSKRAFCVDCKKVRVRSEGCRCKACADQRALDMAEAEGW